MCELSARCPHISPPPRLRRRPRGSTRNSACDHRPAGRSPRRVAAVSVKNVCAVRPRASRSAAEAVPTSRALPSVQRPSSRALCARRRRVSQRSMLCGLCGLQETRIAEGPRVTVETRLVWPPKRDPRIKTASSRKNRSLKRLTSRRSQPLHQAVQTPWQGRGSLGVEVTLARGTLTGGLARMCRVDVGGQSLRRARARAGCGAGRATPTRFCARGWLHTDSRDSCRGRVPWKRVG